MIQKDNNNIHSKDNIKKLDYKNIEYISGFLTEVGSIKSARFNKKDTLFQRKLAKAIKIARVLALIPFCDRHK
jgi:small subunit ribosomal protein S18